MVGNGTAVNQTTRGCSPLSPPAVSPPAPSTRKPIVICGTEGSPPRPTADGKRTDVPRT